MKIYVFKPPKVLRPVFKKLFGTGKAEKGKTAKQA